MQERSLKALGEEYERTAMLVKERIARKRSELRQARNFALRRSIQY